MTHELLGTADLPLLRLTLWMSQVESRSRDHMSLSGVFHLLASWRERALDEGTVKAYSPGDLGKLAPHGAWQMLLL